MNVWFIGSNWNYKLVWDDCNLRCVWIIEDGVGGWGMLLFDGGRWGKGDREGVIIILGY